MRYNKYSDALKKRYGEKIYKIPINLPITCPNRDGTLGSGGCVFCGDIAAGFEAQSNEHSVAEQIKRNIAIVAPKYKVSKFIAYFQNYTNTYMQLELFTEYVRSACIENVVGISISTRPDCVGDDYLRALNDIANIHDVQIEIELGLQSINVNTLKKVNRGHGLSEYVDAVLRIKQYGFSICTHIIGNLPWDTELDFYEAAKLINVLHVDGVKIHSLYILKNTILGEWYNEGAFSLDSSDVYIDRVIHFIRLLNPNVVIQRLFGRAPEEKTLFCNWGTSWRKLQNTLDERMEMLDYRQGDLYKTYGTGGTL